MDRIRAALTCMLHFCQRLRGKVEPDHVVVVCALLLTGRSDSPMMTACAYMVILVTHTTHAMRAESRRKAELHAVENRESELEAEVKRDEELEHIG